MRSSKFSMYITSQQNEEQQNTALDKCKKKKQYGIKHHCILKSNPKIRNRRPVLRHPEAYASQIILKVQTLKSFPLISEIRPSIYFITCNVTLEGRAIENAQGEELMCLQARGEGSNCPVPVYR